MFVFLKTAFSKLTSLFQSDQFKTQLNRVQELVPDVLKYVQLVSALTHNAAIDTLAARLSAMLNTPVAKEVLSDPNALQGLLKAAARTMFRQEFPTVSDSDRVVNGAIELAYIAFRTGAQ